ncbi:hypothetical protein L3X38_018893 [Prunus dulcis]|uniref:Uncharacterized protein n=1 Tax=Prunus dulcis TaxID=3755 RepID=A0AAD4ZBG2_PRUDU|nr:hypothetical protein L3X38_018893 [Prunus dulcis]
MVGSKRIRSNTAATTQSAMGLSCHDCKTSNQLIHSAVEIVTAVTTLAHAVAPPHDTMAESAMQAHVFAPPLGLLAKGATPPQVVVTEITAIALQLPGQVVSSKSHHPYGLVAESNVHHYHDAMVCRDTIAHGRHGVVADYDPILEQLHPFLFLPPRLTNASAYTFNKTLAYVQLGSIQFSYLDPSNEANLSLRVN